MATVIAGLELILLVLAGLVLLGKSLAPEVESAARREALRPAPKRTAQVARVAAAKPVKPARTAAILPRGRTVVVILNGNGIAGAAADTATLARARGYRTGKVANAPRSDYPRTIVMYRPGFSAEGRRFARDLDIRVVTPLDGMKPKALHGAQLALIVGRTR